MTDRPSEPEDLVEQDDAVIGRAFRVSLVVMAVVALLGVAGWFLLGGEDAPGETREAEIVAPTTRTDTVTAPRLPFVDLTAAAGIDFARENGARGDKFLPETMGGGCAFLDFDVDGDADLLLVNGTPWPRGEGGVDVATGSALLENDGTGRFRDVSSETGLDAIHVQGMGCAVADFDADGDPDVLLTAVGDLVLLENAGGRFVDASDRLEFAADPERWTTAATFFDGDRDGDLDLFVAAYVRWSEAIDREVDYTLTGLGKAYGPPTNYGGDQSLYFVQEDGRFVERGGELGLHVVNEATGVPVGKALGAAPVDVDGDGWTDLFVANDTTRNFLFMNREGRFEEVGVRAGVAFGRSGTPTGAMGVDVADFRGDGELGFVVGNFANEMSSLYVTQAGTSQFVDESIVEGIGAPSRLRLSFGVFYFDADLDGRLDLLQVNGHLEEEIQSVQASQEYRQLPQLFWNGGLDSRTTFVEVEDTGDLGAKKIVGRGAAYADIDADGDLDVLLTQSFGAPLLLRNDQQTGHHFLHLRLFQPGMNRDAIGAWVTLETAAGTQRRQVMPARSYLSHVEPKLFFGLGDAASVERCTVTWPDGEQQDVAIEGVDRLVTIRR